MGTSLSPWQPLTPQTSTEDAETSFRPFLLVAALILGLFVVGIVLVYTPILHPGSGGGTPADASAVERILLDADPGGAALSFVLTDANGQDAAMSGSVDIQVQVTNSSLWEVTRDVTPDDFAPLPSGNLMTGRLGYRTVIAPDSWAVQPLHGAPTRVTVIATTDDGNVFSSVDTVTFP